MKTLVIYEPSALGMETAMVSFSVKGKVSDARMNEMFAEAAKQLGVKESELVYDIFN